MPDMDRLKALCNVVERAMALARERAPAQSTRKAHQDYVTDVDLAVDTFLAETLPEILPGVPVLSEERATEIEGPLDLYWIVDPIDGTGNLIAGLPFVGIAVALVDAKGPLLACVGNLADQRCYSALRGYGAFRTSAAGRFEPLDMPEAAPELIVLSTGILDALATDPASRWPALRAIGKIRNLGAQSLHLCGVACGQFAAVASIEAKVWDEAAGGLIIREAGGFWSSSADYADWSRPAVMMNIPAQRSLAAHPRTQQPMAAALNGLLA